MSVQKDIFLCHAREDKHDIVKPLVIACEEAGISYWYDEAEIKWGDSIPQKVNENCDDIISYVKNYLSVHFRIDYINARGDISNYYPDFIVKKSEKKIFIIETKGQEDLDVPLKMKRLKQWCEDINSSQKEIVFDFIFADEESFQKYKLSSFGQLMNTFKEYKED